MYKSMHSGVHIPGDVSVDIVESVRMALSKIRPPHRPLEFSRHYMAATRDKIKGIAPAARQAFTPTKTHIPITGEVLRTTAFETAEDKAKRVKCELLAAGITAYGLFKSESRVLPKVLHPNEHVKAIVYGQHHSNSVMLVATDERIIYLDKKPMSLFLDEVSYEVVSGIQFEIHMIFASLTLHTPVKNYDIKYANLRCAEKFARHIETHRLKREQPEKRLEAGREVKLLGPMAPGAAYPDQLKEYMAGYYWLPIADEELEKQKSKRIVHFQK